MKFDNRKNVYMIWFRKLLLTIILLLLIILFGFSDYFKNPVFGIDNSIFLIGLGIIYIIIIILNAILQQTYVFFSDAVDKIIMRYYPIRVLNQKKSSIEIPKSKFVKYEIEKFFFGMKEKIILYQKTKDGIAHYPSISLSAVDKKDRENIKKALSQYMIRK